MNFICKITFRFGGLFGGYRIYVVELSDELSNYTKLWEEEEPFVLLDEDDETGSRKIITQIAAKAFSLYGMEIESINYDTTSIADKRTGHALNEM